MECRGSRSGICTHPPVGVSRYQDEADWVQVSLPSHCIDSQLFETNIIGAYSRSCMHDCISLRWIVFRGEDA